MKRGRLEHAEHDGADKGESDVGGDNAQSADHGHGNAPFIHVVAKTIKVSSVFPA